MVGLGGYNLKVLPWLHATCSQPRAFEDIARKYPGSYMRPHIKTRSYGMHNHLRLDRRSDAVIARAAAARLSSGRAAVSSSIFRC